MMEYKEEDNLNIAGIQHYSFCPRQWGIIHIEKQWDDNVLTISGNIVHEKAHDDSLTEKRGNIIITRGLEIRSSALGVNGVCDVVEFHKSIKGIPIYGWEGKYLPIPVEYKKGKPKEINADKLQLCCQAMCLEEMLGCEISYAYLYYDEIKKRETVHFDSQLREEVITLLEIMHKLYDRKITPKATESKKCKSCSINEICLPSLQQKLSASEYIERMLNSNI